MTPASVVNAKKEKELEQKAQEKAVAAELAELERQAALVLEAERVQAAKKQKQAQQRKALKAKKEQEKREKLRQRDLERAQQAKELEQRALAAIQKKEKAKQKRSKHVNKAPPAVEWGQTVPDDQGSSANSQAKPNKLTYKEKIDQAKRQNAIKAVIPYIVVWFLVLLFMDKSPNKYAVGSLAVFSCVAVGLGVATSYLLSIWDVFGAKANKDGKKKRLRR